MKKHTLLRILFVIPLLLSAVLFSAHFSKAEAKSKTCSIWQRSGQVFSLAKCDSFEYVSGWIATDKELIEEFQNGALVTVTVSGEKYLKTFSPEGINSLWTDPVQVPTAYFGLKCTSGQFMWRARYYLPVGSLEAGTYTLKQTIDPLYPLTDGIVDNCTWSDGSPITEVPAFITEEVTYTDTFVVSP